MVVSSFAIGALAIPVFDLGFVDSLLTIFFINLLGTIPVAFFSTFGPRFGMRQMILSRFFFGYYGVKVIALFNCLACLGWSAVNVIVGAQLLHAVNANVPGYAGIIVIAACTFIITLFGYKVSCSLISDNDLASAGKESCGSEARTKSPLYHYCFVTIHCLPMMRIGQR